MGRRPATVSSLLAFRQLLIILGALAGADKRAARRGSRSDSETVRARVSSCPPVFRSDKWKPIFIAVKSRGRSSQVPAYPGRVRRSSQVFQRLAHAALQLLRFSRDAHRHEHDHRDCRRWRNNDDDDHHHHDVCSRRRNSTDAK